MAELNEGAHARVELAEKTLDTTTISIVGEIDISNDVTVQHEVERLLEPRPQRLVLDLAELTFMDSSGIAVLLRVAATVARVDVRNATRAVRRIIETTGVDSVLHLEP
jgi:anti-sigma B factor antagonist